MLVLTRKQNQEILIGDNIKITVLKTKGNTVRLGIEAPRDVNVLRGELPRHNPSPEPVPEPASPDNAEFTVVFSNTDEVQRSKVDLIPFEANSSGNNDSNKIENPSESRRMPQQDRGGSNESSKSIQFRGALPAGLQHNRLKEIVNQLAANPESMKR